MREESVGNEGVGQAVAPAGDVDGGVIMVDEGVMVDGGVTMVDGGATVTVYVAQNADTIAAANVWLNSVSVSVAALVGVISVVFLVGGFFGYRDMQSWRREVKDEVRELVQQESRKIKEEILGESPSSQHWTPEQHGEQK